MTTPAPKVHTPAAPAVKIPPAAPKAGAVAVPAAAPRAPVTAGSLAAELGLLSSHDEAGHAKPKIGLWGAGLSGKTGHALSWPSPFVLNFDPNTSTLRGQGFAVPYVQVRDFRHMQALQKVAEDGRLTELVRTMPGFESYTVRTLVIDSSTFQSHLIEEHLDTQTFAGRGGKDDTRARYQEKLRILNRFGRSMDKAAEPQRGKEAYAIITTIHEKIQVDEKGAIVAVKADITGDYNRLIFQHQDVNFFCELVVQEIAGDKTGRAVANTRPSAVVHTIPPSKFHNVVADRLGGLGRYRLLPAKLTPKRTHEGGLYATLYEHWGITKEDV